jgi:hypothetical protein
MAGVVKVAAAGTLRGKEARAPGYPRSGSVGVSASGGGSELASGGHRARQRSGAERNGTTTTALAPWARSGRFGGVIVDDGGFPFCPLLLGPFTFHTVMAREETVDSFVPTYFWLSFSF